MLLAVEVNSVNIALDRLLRRSFDEVREPAGGTLEVSRLSGISWPGSLCLIVRDGNPFEAAVLKLLPSS
jgi:hypothetical protein